MPPPSLSRFLVWTDGQPCLLRTAHRPDHAQLSLDVLTRPGDEISLSLQDMRYNLCRVCGTLLDKNPGAMSLIAQDVRAKLFTFFITHCGYGDLAEDHNEKLLRQHEMLKDKIKEPAADLYEAEYQYSTGAIRYWSILVCAPPVRHLRPFASLTHSDRLWQEFSQLSATTTQTSSKSVDHFSHV